MRRREQRDRAETAEAWRCSLDGVERHFLGVSQRQQPQQLVEQRREEVDHRSHLHCVQTLCQEHCLGRSIEHQFRKRTKDAKCKSAPLRVQTMCAVCQTDVSASTATHFVTQPNCLSHPRFQLSTTSPPCEPICRVTHPPQIYRTLFPLTTALPTHHCPAHPPLPCPPTTALRTNLDEVEHLLVVWRLQVRSDAQTVVLQPCTVRQSQPHHKRTRQSKTDKQCVRKPVSCGKYNFPSTQPLPV